MTNRNIVLKIGGSLFFNKKHEINSKKIIEFCKIVQKSKNHDLIVIIVGGGTIAREYIDFVRSETKNEALSDLIGIDISRINARMLISYFGDLAYPLVPKSIDDLSIAKLTSKIIVMGGLQPGQSTTSVALEVAEYIKASEVIILTDVGGVYDKDPKKFPNAKLMEKVNYSQLTDMILKRNELEQAAAGEYRIFDAVSLQILKRSKIKTRIGSGLDLNQFKKYWNGEINNIGTNIIE